MEKENQNKEDGDNKGRLIPGVILVVLGIMFLLPKLGIDFGNLWPTFILAPGAALFIFYFAAKDRTKHAGVIIPAMITTLIAFFFYGLNFSDWDRMANLWPVFPLIVGISFYTFYYASGGKERGILIPANILSIIGILFLIMNYLSFNFWPLILIIAGVVVILTAQRSHGKGEDDIDESKNE